MRRLTSLLANKTNAMEYVFYIVILLACVYVIAGIVFSTFLSATEISRSELPPAVEQEFVALFPDFVTQAVKRQKARHRYLLEGKYANQPSQLMFALTPESELTILEYSRVDQPQKFQKLRVLSNAQIPAKVASKLKPFFADDQAQFETGMVQLGLIGKEVAYRIDVDSKAYRYHFDVAETGELYKFSRKEVA